VWYFFTQFDQTQLNDLLPLSEVPTVSDTETNVSQY